MFSNKGEFSFSSQIDYPTLARISWFGQSIFLPVFPGDSIKLEINASEKNEDLYSLVKIHSKSNFEIDSYIYELNKEVGGIKNKISVKEKNENYIAKAKTDDQMFFATIYLAYFEQNKISVKGKKLKFLAFYEVMNKYPKALNYNEPLKSLVVNESNEFFKTSSLKNSSIRIHDNKFNTFSELIDKIRKDNLGNVVFIDLWGTWCGACLYDIKHKKELGMDEIFDKFSVRTVYLCKTSPKKEFDFYVQKLDMKGDHYFLSKDLAQDAKINFNVIFYPHYMLLNKKGELINNNVPRPIITSGGDVSLNKELINLIEQLSE